MHENDTVTLTGEFEQLGLAVPHRVLIDWGDGNTSTLDLDPPAQPGTESFVIEHQYLDDDPTGTPSDDYTIQVTVEDNDGDTDSETVSLAVLNVAPMLSDVSATDVLENGLSTLTGTITDPGALDTIELFVDWGDGSSDAAVVVFGAAPEMGTGTDRPDRSQSPFAAPGTDRPDQSQSHFRSRRPSLRAA